MALPMKQDTIRLAMAGRVRRIDARFTTTITDPADIRFTRDLAGGAMMDLGFYPVHWVRTFMGEEPGVVCARAVEGAPGVDVTMTGELAFPGGATGRVHASMVADRRFTATVEIECERGTLGVENPLAPQLGNQITLRTPEGVTGQESIDGGSTYRYQLAAFAEAVRTGAPLPAGGADPANTLRVLDALYAAAGLPPRASEAPLPADARRFSDHP